MILFIVEYNCAKPVNYAEKVPFGEKTFFLTNQQDEHWGEGSTRSSIKSLKMLA